MYTYSICFRIFPFRRRLIADKTASFKVLQLRFACPVTGKLYLSLRNQCMLIKLDYASKQIDWVATPGVAAERHCRKTDGAVCRRQPRLFGASRIGLRSGRRPLLGEIKPLHHPGQFVPYGHQ